MPKLIAVLVNGKSMVFSERQLETLNWIREAEKGVAAVDVKKVRRQRDVDTLVFVGLVKRDGDVYTFAKGMVIVSPAKKRLAEPDAPACESRDRSSRTRRVNSARGSVPMGNPTVWDMDAWLISVLEEPRRYDGDITRITLVKLKNGAAYVGDYVSHTRTEIVVKLVGTNASVSFEREKIKFVEMHDESTGYLGEWYWGDFE